MYTTVRRIGETGPPSPEKPPAKFCFTSAELFVEISKTNLVKPPLIPSVLRIQFDLPTPVPSGKPVTNGTEGIFYCRIGRSGCTGAAALLARMSFACNVLLHVHHRHTANPQDLAITKEIYVLSRPSVITKVDM